MATKKAKKNNKKSTPTTKVTTKVVTKTETPGRFNFLKGVNKADDINGIFSAKTLSMLFVEMLGTMIIATLLSATQASQPFIMFIVVAGLALIFSNFTVTFFNPIISFGLWISRKISAQKALLTILAQVLGAMLAVILLTKYLHITEPLVEGQLQTEAAIFKISTADINKIGWFVFVSELICGTLVGFMVAQSAKKSAAERAVIVGLATFIGLFMALALTGAAKLPGLLNPVMTIPMFSFTKDNWQWITAAFIVAPLIGSAIGFLLDKVLAGNSGTKTTVKS